MDSIAENFSERMDALMSLRAEFLASLRACLDHGWEAPTSVGNGPKQSDWCASLDLPSLSLRTRQRSLLSNPGEPSTELCQKWPRSGMIVCGMFFPRPLLGPVIGESDFASFLPTATTSDCRPDSENGNRRSPKLPNVVREFLPTPTASPNKESMENFQRRQSDPNATKPSKTTEMAVKLAMAQEFLPTPTANDALKRGSAYWQEKRDQTTFGDNLPRAIAKHYIPTHGLKKESLLIPTPTAADGQRGGRGDLLAIAKERPNKHTKWMLPTPTASMLAGGDTKQDVDRPFQKKLPQVIRELLVPTPWASANESRQTKLTPSQQAGTHGLSLQATILSALGPTPTARDFKDTPGMTVETADGRVRDDQLPRRVFQTLKAESVAPLGGKKLTPEFQSWLMGFPPDWLKPLRSALAIASSRKRSSPSPKPSPKP